ncbi:MAG: hypothetical protein J4F35_22890 [Candidatus Latescibacteria bacterium]|nr:hypothetical protein [Candidatus Latescibacterota bacterium]
MAPVRIGVIGCGAVAQVQHLPNLTALKDLLHLAELGADRGAGISRTAPHR